jgi:hypothetical protein
MKSEEKRRRKGRSSWEGSLFKANGGCGGVRLDPRFLGEVTKRRRKTQDDGMTKMTENEKPEMTRREQLATINGLV